MEIIIGILVVIIVIQEIRIHRLVDRLLLQAAVPKDLRPVRVAPPVASNDSDGLTVTPRKKIMSVTIPS